MRRFWRRPKQMSAEDFHKELDELIHTIEGDSGVSGARMYAENNGDIAIFGVWHQESTTSQVLWVRHFSVPGCPHCTILDWDARTYPEKESGRDRYRHQVLSGSRPSVEVALSPAAEAAEIAEAAGEDLLIKPLVLLVPDGLSGRVHDSCLDHAPAEL